MASYINQGLKDMKISIDQVLTVLQIQSNKQRDNDLLLQSLGGKLDIQGHRLMLLESDVKFVKEMVEKKCQVGSENLNTLSITHSAVPDQSMKTEILQAIQSQSDELKSVVKTENQELSQVLTKYSSDVTLKLNDAQTAISDLKSDLKMAVICVEDLNKTHVEDQRLERLVNDLKVVKEIVQTCELTKKESCMTEPAGALDNQNKLLSMKNEIIQEIQTNSDGLKSLVKDETGKLTEVCVKSSLDVMTKVESLETILSESRSELKQVVRCIEDVDRGVRAVENSTNGYSQVIQDIQHHLPPMKQLKTAVQTLAVEKPPEVVGQLMNKEEIKSDTQKIQILLTKKFAQFMTKGELVEKINSLNQSIQKNQSSLENVEKKVNEDKVNLDPQNVVRDIEKKVEEKTKILQLLNQQMFDQTIAECQILREVLTNTRKIRKIYKCNFFVRDFSKYRQQFSHLWFIDQLNTHVKGSVNFKENNTKMSVWLDNGRYPRVVGLDTKEGQVCTVRVKVVKEGKKNWEIGCREKCGFDEKNVCSPELDGWDSATGYEIVSLSCNDLTTNDWVDEYNRILLRYEISFH